MRHSLLVVGLMALVAGESFAAAKNRYVSKDLDYGSGPNGEVVSGDAVYSDIQTAANACNNGDTVWVKDGFVCETGSTWYSYSSNRVCITKAITLRSQSGVVDEAKGKGATIRGNRTGLATAYVRCVKVTASTTIKGFLLENGASEAESKAGSYAGGACSGAATILDCVVRNCRSKPLQGTTSLKRTIIENCSGGPCLSSSTCPVNDCVFRNNTTAAMGYNGSESDPAKWQVVSNTVFCTNARVGAFSAHSSYSQGCIFRDCVMSNNYAITSDLAHGGAIYGRCRLYNCTLCYNVSSHTSSSSGGGAVSGYGKTAYLYDCDVYGNVVTNGNQSGSGGGVREAYCYRTKFHDNYTQGYGGGAGECVLVDCEVYDNEASNAPGCSGSNGANGGGLYKCTATNCVIRDNIAVHRGAHPSPGYGGGVWNVDGNYTLVNCLIVSNSASKQAAGVYASGTGATRLINCTVADNLKNKGVSGNVSLVNTIVWGNAATGDTVLSATNSCASILTDTTTYPGCVSTDPKFIGSGATPYGIRMHSPCKNAGLAFGWMTDPTCVASKDLAGNDRLIGPKPDMGCYERKPVGLMLLVR